MADHRRDCMLTAGCIGVRWADGVGWREKGRGWRLFCREGGEVDGGKVLTRRECKPVVWKVLTVRRWLGPGAAAL